MTANSQPIWLDCDPGIDDAIALLTLLGRPDVNLVGISTTHGNVALTQTTRNALDLLNLAGRATEERGGSPVYAGAASPLVREPIYAPDIHGAGGLGGVELATSSQPIEPLHGALALAQALQAQPGEVTLLATGPLTNLALAERLYPGVLRLARQVVIMGGSLEMGAPKLGNVTERAEFNAYADPEALHVLLQSGANPALLGLNLTRQVVVDEARAAQLEAVGTLAGGPHQRQLYAPLPAPYCCQRPSGGGIA